MQLLSSDVTYDHRTLRTELPVRSAVLKQGTGGLVVRWVTTSESPLLYVFVVFASSSFVSLSNEVGRWVTISEQSGFPYPTSAYSEVNTEYFCCVAFTS